MNQTINDLKTRRSIRKFKDEQISDEDLKTILETGTYAPTGRGAQSPKIVVIQNPETILLQTRSILPRQKHFYFRKKFLFQ